jgi:predicted DNA-binding protein (MmcQ/YjbR family)
VTIDAIRAFCRTLPGTTEDIKWEHDLVFSVGGRMYAAVDVNPPHALAFKCAPETFAEMIERDGVIPAPYLARAMWVQQQRLDAALERSEIEDLLRAAHEIVSGRSPKKKPVKPAARSKPKAAAGTARKTAAPVKRARARQEGSRRER